MPETPLSRWLHQEMPRKGYPLGPRAGGISQLADEAGISRAALSRIVSGQGIPEPDTLRRIGRVLGYTLGQMLVFAGVAERDELTDPETPPPPVELECVDDTRATVEVSIDPQLTMDEALQLVVRSGGPLTRNERIMTANLEAMDAYSPAEIAGAVLLLRRLAARRAEQQGRPRKQA